MLQALESNLQELLQAPVQPLQSVSQHAAPHRQGGKASESLAHYCGDLPRDLRSGIENFQRAGFARISHKESELQQKAVGWAFEPELRVGWEERQHNHVLAFCILRAGKGTGLPVSSLDLQYFNVLDVPVAAP